MKKRKALHWEQLEQEKGADCTVSVAHHSNMLFYVLVCATETGAVTQLYQLVSGRRHETRFGNLVKEWEGKNVLEARQEAFSLATQ